MAEKYPWLTVNKYVDLYKKNLEIIESFESKHPEIVKDFRQLFQTPTPWLVEIKDSTVAARKVFVRYCRAQGIWVYAYIKDPGHPSGMYGWNPYTAWEQYSSDRTLVDTTLYLFPCDEAFIAEDRGDISRLDSRFNEKCLKRLVEVTGKDLVEESMCTIQ